MLTAKQEWEEYLHNMYSRAFEDFHRTDHYRALRENLDRMEESCESNFREGDFARIMDWIDAILTVNAAECGFMYERGYQDCVALLRRLEVV